jgi:hypothetical protein
VTKRLTGSFFLGRFAGAHARASGLALVIVSRFHYGTPVHMSKSVTGLRCMPFTHPRRRLRPFLAGGLEDRATRQEEDGLGQLGKRPVGRHGYSPCRTLVVLRKEVIQPQVLLRLPCYDLVPIIELTFGAFLPCGLDRRLRVLPTFVA